MIEQPHAASRKNREPLHKSTAQPDRIRLSGSPGSSVSRLALARRNTPSAPIASGLFSGSPENSTLHRKISAVFPAKMAAAETCTGALKRKISPVIA